MTLPPPHIADRPAAATGRIGRFRWVICGLLFAATSINYLDRQMIGVLKPTIQHELGWSETAYADIVFWFQAAYAIGYIGFGPIVDRIGARLGYGVAIIVWTLAHMAHGLISSVLQFTLARCALGLGESGGFPASLKAVTEWFPQRERAFAVGVFNAGSNVGAILTPLIVPAVTIAWGWRMAFFLTGAFSLAWLAVWLAVYRRPAEHRRVSAEELALIQAGQPPAAARPKASLLRLAGRPQTWAYASAKFLTDPIWWMFLFWLPDFLQKRYGLDLKTFGIPLVVIYLVSDLGSLLGGWASSRLIGAGLSVNRARKTIMFVCVVCVTPIVFAQYADNVWMAVGIIGLAAAAHQAWSANLLTLPSDLAPGFAVGSMMGIGGMAGAIGGMLMSKYAGYILDRIGSYEPIFLVAGGAYLAAFLSIQILSPRLARVEL